MASDHDVSYSAGKFETHNIPVQLRNKIANQGHRYTKLRELENKFFEFPD